MAVERESSTVQDPKTGKWYWYDDDCGGELRGPYDTWQEAEEICFGMYRLRREGDR